MVETAELSGIEPFSWLRNSLTFVVTEHPISRLDDLLPWSHLAR
ncbi:MAG: transposase domain-containing protein [Janthinobacterium lividum]